MELATVLQDAISLLAIIIPIVAGAAILGSVLAAWFNR